jgi:hypothetical protein
VPWPEYLLWLEDKLSFPLAVFRPPLSRSDLERVLAFKERKKKKPWFTEVEFHPHSIGSTV